MRMFYPDPQPYKVLGMKAGSTWNHKQEIPSREKFTDYMEGQGLDAAGYDAWVARVEIVKANNAAEAAAKRADFASDTKVEADTIEVPATSTPSPASATPATTATPFTGLAHQRAKPEAVPMEVMSVRVRVGINARLDMYRAKARASKQDIVSDVLDAFLTGQGF